MSDQYGVGMGLSMTKDELRELAEDLNETNLSLTDGLAMAGLDGDLGKITVLLASEHKLVRCADCGLWGDMENFYEQGDDTWLCDPCWDADNDDDDDDDYDEDDY